MQTQWLETLDEIFSVLHETFLDAKATTSPSYVVCPAFSLQMLV